MGNCIAWETSDKTTRGIDKIINRDFQKEQNIIKLLLLGSGDSGKSTVVKQLRYLHGDGLDEKARRTYKAPIFSNLISTASLILNNSEEVFEDPDAQQAAELVSNLRGGGDMEIYDTPEYDLGQDLANALCCLWNNEAFQVLWEKGRMTNAEILDSFQKFMKSLLEKGYPAWGGEDWIPSMQDSMLVRTRTTGIVESYLKFHDVSIRLVDVGGQRNERKKWIHSFNSVTAIFYVAAISEYNQGLFEENSQNRLKESLKLFDDICNKYVNYFEYTPIILFLNKKDLFEEKFMKKKIPLNESGKFPDAPTFTNYDKAAYDKAIAWLTKKYKSRNKNKKRTVFTHVTCATDTRNIDRVFSACKEIILAESITFLS